MPLSWHLTVTARGVRYASRGMPPVFPCSGTQAAGGLVAGDEIGYVP